MSRMWCAACAKMREVEEYDTTDDGDRYATGRVMRVAHLECGHSTQDTLEEYGDQLHDAGLSRGADL